MVSVLIECFLFSANHVTNTDQDSKAFASFAATENCVYLLFYHYAVNQLNLMIYSVNMMAFILQTSLQPEINDANETS